MARALDGIRVLDLSHVMAGPFCTRQLVLLGAEVIKVERPGEGDVMRYYGHDKAFGRNSANFIGYNAGKRSITLDIAKPEGLEILKKLVVQADVLVENFRPGVLARRGLAWDDCRKLNDRLIYCSISGYGQDTSLKDNPAYDHIAQAMSGLMSLQGDEDSPPTKVGFPVIDTFSGHLAAFAIISALLRRERGGGGQYLDVSMLDASMVLMSSVLLKYFGTGKAPKRVGNKGFSLSATADMFQTADRPISIGANTNEQFNQLCRIIGLPHLLEDPRYADPAGRWEHATTLRAEITDVLKQKGAEEWEVLFNRNSIPSAVVRDLAGIARHPYFDERDMFVEVDVPVLERKMKVVGAGFRTDEDAPGSKLPPPDLGQHTDDVLRELGYSPADIDALRAGGVL
ncbi:CaiB/BaiF CoA-transferase family protein [Rhizobium sp. SSA_523]|uniref:CaiB/BaiF CoA transferase family protein n=1 Tax=Rhizobium sp. SSA_523 TaxID=2952477 RepID=UPI002091ABC6|nr:CoA transferase [Rhizobium sp. SSA_523]MCO5731593.1 CoA transferase [Rhizobium sp. SSA_523]WKC21893.1 CoA transferase [Rhizobium sp. SSA_523]